MTTRRRGRRSSGPGVIRRARRSVARWTDISEDNSLAAGQGSQVVLELIDPDFHQGSLGWDFPITVVRTIGKIMVYAPSSAGDYQLHAGLYVVGDEAVDASVFPDPRTDVDPHMWRGAVAFSILSSVGEFSREMIIDTRGQRRLTERQGTLLVVEGALNSGTLAIGFDVTTYVLQN